jgi:DNA-binding GntR family transcriptional regulator
VRKALNDLVERDWLIRRAMSGRQIYGLNPARRTELQQLFESSK